MTYRAFVSSTYEDLKEHRAYAISALRSAGFHVDPMEEWTSDPRTPRTFCIDAAGSGDLFVLIVGMRRGFIPSGDARSITELEYASAQDAGLDVMVFMLNEESLWYREFDDLNSDPALREWRSTLLTRHGVSFFTAEPHSLAIAPALTRWVLRKTVSDNTDRLGASSWMMDHAINRLADRDIAHLFRHALTGSASEGQIAEAERAAIRYTSSLEERLNFIRVFGMEQPVPLRDVFIRVHLLDKIASRERVSIDYLEKSFDADRRSFGIPAATRDGSWLSGQAQFRIDPQKAPKLPTDLLVRLTRLRGIDGRLVTSAKEPHETRREFSNRHVKTLHSILFAALPSEDRPAKNLADALTEVFRSDSATFHLTPERLGKLATEELFALSILWPLSKTHLSSEADFRLALNSLLQQQIAPTDWEILRAIFETTPGKFIVLGRPGAGKTTLLKFLALRMITTTPERFRIPVFISLKDATDSRQSLLKRIAREFTDCGVPAALATSLAQNLLLRGCLSLLLDGLDEVGGDNLERSIQEISRLADQYNNNEWIISCRVAAYNHWFSTFADVELAEFGQQEIDEFVRLWFTSEPDTAQYCLSELAERPATKELGSNPLLLTLLCLAFNRTMGFPSSRSELYREATDALLRSWDARRRIKRAEIYRALSPKQKEVMLSRIALSTFENGTYFIRDRDLAEMIEEFLDNLPHNNHDEPPDGIAILAAIEAQHGILVERAKGIYSFSHLTLQEYFAATSIASGSAADLSILVDDRMEEPAWREVFLLTSEILSDATELILKMASKVAEFGRGWNRDFAYLNTVARAARLYGPLESRALALNFVLRGGTAESDSARGICEVVLAVEDHKRSADAIEASSHRVGVASEVGVLPKEGPDPLWRLRPASTGRPGDDDRTSLRRYLAAQELLLACLASQCYVEAAVRKRVLAVALLPLD